MCLAFVIELYVIFLFPDTLRFIINGGVKINGGASRILKN